MLTHFSHDACTRGQHGAGVINLLGEEVDRIEQRIQDIAPEVRHVDLEIL